MQSIFQNNPTPNPTTGGFSAQSPQAQNQQPPPLPPKRMTWQESLQLVNQLLVPAQEVLVLLKPNSTFDTVAGAIALGMGLRKIGRKVQVVCPGQLDPNIVLNTQFITQPEKDLIDFSQILNFLPKKQFRLVIDYAVGSFSKGGVKKDPTGLILTLMPNQNEPIIEPLNMITQVFESKPDAAFFIDVENLAHFQNFYTENQAFFAKIPIINVDYHQNNAMFGRANLIDPKASSICEMLTLMLYDLKFVFDVEIAKILYAGIKFKTENFAQNFYTANMLESSSICLRYQQPPPPISPAPTAGQ